MKKQMIIFVLFLCYVSLINMRFAQAADKAYVLRNVLWSDSSTISVCWENPNADNAHARSRVQNAMARSWSAVSALTFVGWGDQCTSSSPGIHIQWNDEGPHTKGLGTQLNGVTNGMVLNHVFRNWSTDCQSKMDFCVETIAIHEFGHALGFTHEQNRPDTPTWCDQEQGPDGDWVIGIWDLDSIMNYCNPSWNGDGKLSVTDIRAVQEIYGHFRNNEFSIYQYSDQYIRGEGHTAKGTAIVIDLRPKPITQFINEVRTRHLLSSKDMDIHACSFEVESVLINTRFANPASSPSVCTSAQNGNLGAEKIKAIECTLKSQDEPILDDAVINFDISCANSGIVNMRATGDATPGITVVIPGNPDSELPFMDAVSFEFVPLVNELVTLNSVKGNYFPSGSGGAPPFPGGAVGVFSISALFQNASAMDICNGGFEIIELQTFSGAPLQIFNARGDGPFGGVGDFVPYNLVSSVRNMKHFEMGELVQFNFNVFVPQKEGIRYVVNMVGKPQGGDCAPQGIQRSLDLNGAKERRQFLIDR